jgi:hypothetical protein
MVTLTNLVDLPLAIRQLVAPEWHQPLIDSGHAARYKKREYAIRIGERDRFVRIGLSGWTALKRGSNIIGLGSVGIQTNAIGKDPKPATADLFTLTEVTAVLLDSALLTEAVTKSGPESIWTIFKWSQMNTDMICAFSAIKCGCPPDIGLAALLWILSTPQPNGTKLIPRGIPQDAIGSVLGVSREIINKRWQSLSTTGYIMEIDGEEYMDATTPMLISVLGF